MIYIGHGRDDISVGHVTKGSCAYNTYQETPLKTQLNASVRKPREPAAAARC